MNRQKLLLATRNSKKAVELSLLLGKEWEIMTLKEFPHIQEVEESGKSFTENARKKAIAISQQVPFLCLGDDSGLEVKALQGAPGIYSARYAGNHGDDVANNQKLLEELKKVPANERQARFRCALCLAKSGKVIWEGEGDCSGYILTEKRGKEGFGYDPLFIPEGHQQTFAELDMEIKNQISHRAKAMKQLVDFLNQSDDIEK